MTSGSGGDMPKVARTRIVAIYRPSDGCVVHLHTVRVFEGGREVTREEAEETARTHATRIGHDVHALKIHHADELPGEFGVYHVDSGRLIGKHPPQHGRRRRQ